MRSDLRASAEAEKSSVMANTDEASKSFAEQSMQASENLERAPIELEALIEKNSKEAKLLDEFSSCWGRLGGLDKGILSLSVQNSNLKALRLSFVPAAIAIRHMEAALNKVMDTETSYPDAAKIIRLASEALIDALNIYALQAPHIAETTDVGMDRIEANMNQMDEQVRQTLNRLDPLVGDSVKPLMSRAQKSYQGFEKINDGSMPGSVEYLIRYCQGGCNV